MLDTEPPHSNKMENGISDLIGVITANENVRNNAANLQTKVSCAIKACDPMKYTIFTFVALQEISP